MPNKKSAKSEKIEQKKISAKEIVYAEIDDEITTLVDRIRRAGTGEVYLVVPQRAVIFQSVVNLRILQKMAGELGKQIYVVTTDRRGRKLVEEVGLNIVEKLEGVDYAPRNIEPSIAVTPLNKKPLENKEKKVQKISIAKIIEKERSDEDKSRLKEKIQSGKKILENAKDEINLATPNKKMLFGFLAGAVALFVGVMYIALPSATVWVEPNSNVIEKTVNVIFADAEMNTAEITAQTGKLVATYPVETTFEKTLSYTATEKIFTGSRAEGWINIYNETAQPWLLIGSTRFQTEEGIIFRIQGGVTVPGSTTDEGGNIIPGKITAKVRADETDAYNDVIGDRGNIAKDTNLVVPGLSQYNQQFVYGKSVEDFAGGVTDYYTIISESDLKSAESRTVAHLENVGISELDKFIEAHNETSQQKWALFNDSKSFETEVLEIDVPNHLQDTQAKEFEVTAKVRVRGVAYDRGMLLSILQRELQSAVHPDKQLISINTEGATLKILADTRNENSGKITVVCVIEGIERWNLDITTEAGSRLVEKIRTRIVNNTKLDAENYVRNLREVRNADVSVWPFWNKNLPSVISSIEVKIKE